MDDEDSSETLRQKQLAALRVCGWLTLLLYVALSMAVVWRTSLHFLYSSRGAKKAFHLTLLVSTLLQLPEAIEWIWFPTSQSWEVMYVCRLYALLLLSFCKSYLAICWAGVVSAGQQLARRRITKLVTVLNALLVLWGVLVPILLSQYSDDIYGQYSFMHSTLRGVMTYSGVVIVLAYGVLLGYQGFRLRRRLLLARGTVPASSVEKSLNQLMLAIFIFIVSDIVRLLALLLNEMGTPMSMIVYLILYNIIPNVFPTICMLYLMRRLTGRGGSDVGVSHIKGVGGKRTLSKYMTEPDSDGSSSTGSDSAGQAYNDNAITRAQWEAQQQYLAHQIQSAREAQHSPAFCWVRESMELR
ncbi:RxLR effector candidate protein [Phytophthora palmivora]|uniref:RxLR effector candidate protein n=1 Tax=Phytophthora palmivora TaxID=4796 RepID=A0A2P4YAR4_9STRA|nr:RxLR effector candidate protein [Phytophthora palmivora]